MKSFLFSFLLVVFTITLNAQNLVSNGSFEEFYSCPNSTGQVDSCLHWFAVQNTPDYFAACAPYPTSVPDNFAGSQYPFEGNSYMGFYTYIWAFHQYREIIGIKLSDKLIPDNTYHVSMRVSRGNWTKDANNQTASDKLGIRFTIQELPRHTIPGQNDTSLVTNYAQLYTDSIITDTLNWTLLHWNYVPDSAYSYMYIGNFFRDELTDTVNVGWIFGRAYYFIDSVNVLCVSDNCFTLAQNIIPNDIRMLFESSSNTLSVRTDNSNGGVLSIVNVTGQEIRKEKVSNEAIINLSGLQAGLYIAALKIEKKVMTQKIFIQ